MILALENSSAVDSQQVPSAIGACVTGLQIQQNSLGLRRQTRSMGTMVVVMVARTHRHQCTMRHFNVIELVRGLVFARPPLQSLEIGAGVEVIELDLGDMLCRVLMPDIWGDVAGTHDGLAQRIYTVINMVNNDSLVIGGPVWAIPLGHNIRITFRPGILAKGVGAVE